MFCSKIDNAPTCIEVRQQPNQFTESGDVGNTTGTAQAISIGEEVYGTLDSSVDWDFYSINLTAGVTYVINLATDNLGSGLSDPYLHILDSTGGSVLENNDGGAGFNSYALFTPSTTGTYYMVADSFSGEQGGYFLTVQQDDIPENTSTDATLDPYSVLTGQTDMDSNWDDDWYQVALDAGVTYTFTMATSYANSGNGNTNGYVEVHGSTGNLITANTTSVEYTPTTSGTYYISAGADSNAASGTYSIEMSLGSTSSPLAAPLNSLDWGFSVPDHNASTTATDIYVYFVPGGISFNDGDAYVSSTWSTNEINAAVAAFDSYEAVANLQFHYVSDPLQADFAMVLTTGTGALGYWGVGGGTVTVNSVNYTLNGWGVFEDGGTGWTSSGLAVGGYGYITLVHEIGHGLGLAHPHDTGGNSVVMDGVTGAFGSTGTYGLNQGIYTTMSYNDGWYSMGGSASLNYGWQATPMALDIAVLQENYGANTTANNGANIYTLPGTNAAGTFFSCIWDTGGTDLIAYSGSLDAYIDLRAATLLNEVGGGGFVSYVDGIDGGFTIANGVEIENASGGSGADLIFGNDLANVLDGGAGIDQLFGFAGNDSIYGDNSDIVFGGDDYDIFYNSSADFRGYNLFGAEIEQMICSENGNTVTIVRNTDGSIDEATYDTANTQTYDFYANHYTSNWELYLQQFIEDNGNIRNLGFDIAGTETYQYYQNTYNSINQLLNQIIKDDNGNERVLGYDVYDTETYLYYQNTFDAVYNLLNQVIRDDNGNERILGYDAYGTEAWQYYQNTYDSGGSLIESFYYMDNGTYVYV
ncbi:MAG: M10 family metallopeptidase [Rhizobiaceae bacterium]